MSSDGEEPKNKKGLLETFLGEEGAGRGRCIDTTNERPSRISFEKSGRGERVSVPYSRIRTVFFLGATEIRIFVGESRIRVNGVALASLYVALHKETVVAIRELSYEDWSEALEKCSDEQGMVNEVIVQKLEWDSSIVEVAEL